MKAGLVGLPGSGKSSLFRAITRSDGTGDPFRTVSVPDPRVDGLAEIYSPKKVTYAQVHVEDFDGLGADERKAAVLYARMREMDALAIVIRAFEDPAYPHERPEVDVAQDLDEVMSSFQLADFVMVENRVEKLEKSIHKPTKTQEQDKKELALLQRLRELLEGGGQVADLEINEAEEMMIRGFRFLTQKPAMVLVNLPDDGGDEAAARAAVGDRFSEVLCVRGGLEAEIAQLDAEDAAAFMDDFGIEETVRDTLIRSLYRLLGLQSFLTAGPDECRAWTIRQGDTAHVSAGAIHSDIQRGFIRAEVIRYGDLVESGGFKEAKAGGKMSLEGKEYVVQDGDVINFRFNV